MTKLRWCTAFRLKKAVKHAKAGTPATASWLGGSLALPVSISPINVNNCYKDLANIRPAGDFVNRT